MTQQRRTLRIPRLWAPRAGLEGLARPALSSRCCGGAEPLPSRRTANRGPWTLISARASRAERIESSPAPPAASSPGRSQPVPRGAGTGSGPGAPGSREAGGSGFKPGFLRLRLRQRIRRWPVAAAGLSGWETRQIPVRFSVQKWNSCLRAICAANLCRKNCVF